MCFPLVLAILFLRFAIVFDSFLARGANREVADSIGFRCPDSTGDIDYVVEKDSTETSDDTGVDLVDDTYVNLGIIIKGTTEIVFFVGNAKIGTIKTNIPDNVAMTPTIEVRNSSAAVTLFSADYLFVESRV